MVLHRGALWRRTTSLTIVAYAVVVGIWLARYEVTPSYVWLITIICICLLLRRKTVGRLAILLIVGLGLGLVRGQVAWQDYKRYDEYFGTKVSLLVRAAEDAVYNDKAQLSFTADFVQLHDNDRVINLPGRVQISGYGAVAVYRGDEVRVSGKLRPSRGSKVAQVSFAEVTVMGRSEDTLQQMRQSFAAGMQTALPEPMASFGLGVLIGQRSTLPKEVNEELSVAGLTHLVAVSGYNLTILVQAARKLFAKRSHFQATLLAVFLIIGFLLCTGFSASIVRAAIVSSISMAAGYYGRSVKPLLLIALAAVITGMAHPLYVWFDVSWYLSFSAFFGVIVVAPLVVRRLWGEREPKMVWSVCIESAAAQVATLPIIMLLFGRVSVYSLASNVLAVPFVPLAMLFSFLAGIGGMLSPALGGIMGLPARVLLRYILDIARFFAGLPRSSVEFYITPLELVFFYSILTVMCILMQRTIHRQVDRS